MDGRPVMAATMIRGHLELHSPATADQLAAITGLPSTPLLVGLAALEAEGTALQGHFTTDGPDGPVEWCSRRLLARMHARSRRQRRRAAGDPVTPEQFVRFLTRWQHVAPGTQVRGPAGLGRILEQLQGWEAAVASWPSRPEQSWRAARGRVLNEPRPKP